MRNLKCISWVVIASLLLAFVSCEKEEDAPELPPYETMAMDFSKFSDAESTSTKGAKMSDAEQVTIKNWFFSSVTIGVWNTVLFTTLAVPVASFKTSFANLPVYLGKAKWQWSYQVEGFAGQYQARLTGEVKDEEVIWEMYVSRTGVNAFDEMMWFSGVSARDRSQGHWILNHSAAFPEEMLRIDWKRENEEVGNIKYTYIRDLKNDRETDSFKNSYVVYGEQDDVYNLFYDVHAYSESVSDFVDTEIEWSQTNSMGRVKAQHFYKDEAWHCWNDQGHDVDCE